MKHLFTLILSLLLFSIVQAQTATAPSGSGSSNDPYQIATLDNLYWLSQTTSVWTSGHYFIQTADIQASATSTWNGGAGFSPIGNDVNKFLATYDGKGHIIDSLYINRPSATEVGLFGSVSNGYIQYLGTTNVRIKGSQVVGGLIGINNSATVISCFSTGAVSGTNTVGGLIGTNLGGVWQCYSRDTVSASYWVGGFVGYDNGGLYVQCYSTGHVSATSATNGLPGGFVGKVYSTSTTNINYCLYDKESAGVSYDYDNTPGYTTAQMKTKSTYTNLSWTFTHYDMRSTVNNGYPYLTWLNNNSYFTPFLPSGSGTQSDPYQIANLHNLSWLCQSNTIWASGNYFIQTSDIDAAQTENWDFGKGFVPIGNDTTSFAGNYNGHGHIIDGLYINRPTENNLGLFRTISGTSVYDLGLTNINITGGTNFVGGLFALNANSTISGCFTTGTITSSALKVGGLLGNNYSGSISDCYSMVSISGSGSTYVGGLVGDNYTGATIANSYSVGLVTSSATSVGGFSGRNLGTISNSFWDTETSGQTISEGGTGKTTAEMQSLATFADVGWDFQGETANGTADIWGINPTTNSGYPFLSWQGYSSLPVAPNGSGTQTDPYQIATLGNLYWVTQSSSSWSSYFEQTADIDATDTKNWESGAGFLPIGNNTINFKGHYNGKGHIINNLTINRPTNGLYNGVGLFGNTGSGSVIDSLGMQNVNISGPDNYVGGLVGVNAYGSITSSFTTGNVSGNGNYVGGLVGQNYTGTISNCYSMASVTCSGYGLGGLVGFNISGTISYSYSNGSVSGGTTNVGGLVGGNNSGTTTNSFWDTETSGQTTSADGTGKTTVEMQTKSTFTDSTWNFTNTWGIMYKLNQGYPYLLWQNYPLPTITSFSPTSGPVGTTVTINGTHFNTTASSNIVRFGATQATVNTTTNTSLIVTVPDGADYRYITVTDTTTGFTASSAQPFIVTFTDGGNYAATGSYATGNAPFRPTTGDFNGDGIPDLAVVNSGENTVSVLLGNGDGTFQSQVTYPTGSGPDDVTTGDFNGDGILDLAVAIGVDGIAPGSVSILLGNGDGTFQAKTDYAVGGAWPISIITGDFNGDGITDLAVTNYGSNTVSILLGNGNGKFESPVTYPVGTNPRGLTTSDFNDDGILDLAVTVYTASTYSSVAILLGKGDGTFQAPVTYPAGNQNYYITTGDFNGDGIPDLAVTNAAPENTVSVLLGNGNGTFQARVTYSTGNNPYDLTTGDFNGDGILDLAVVNGYGIYSITSTVSILTGKGDGTFEPKKDYATAGYIACNLTSGDFNGDGKTDLAVANNASNTVSILENISFPPTITSFSPTSGPVGTTDTIKGTHFNTTASNNMVYFGATQATVNAATDTSLIVTVPDGANYRNITVTDTTTGQTAYSDKPFIVTFNKGGYFAPKVDYGTLNDPVAVTNGDFNSDGIPDLAVTNYNADSVSIFIGNSDVTYKSKVDYPSGSGPEGVSIGDFNGDGIQDLAAANSFTNTVSVLLGKGDGTFHATTNYITDYGPLYISIGDFNDDGKQDLATANYSSNTVSVLLGRGDGSFYPKTDYTVENHPTCITSGDFNGDGKTDLAVTSSTSSTVSILLGYNGLFTTPVTYSTGSISYNITIGDFNGDGIPDLAVANYVSGTVSVLLGKGDGKFAAKVDYGSGSRLRGITTGDFNGDGITDLAASDNSTAKIYVFLGNGDGTFQAQMDYETGNYPAGLTSGDFNGDGKTDLAVTNSNTVSILYNVEDLVAVCKNTTIYLDDNGTSLIDSSFVDGGSSAWAGIKSIALDKYSFDCSDIGLNTVTLTVTDSVDNTDMCSATVTVKDTVSPVANCQNVTVYLDASGQASATAAQIDSSSFDNCSIDSMWLDKYDFTSADTVNNLVTLTVTDASGNSSTCTASVTEALPDNIAPNVKCNPITIYLDEAGKYPLTDQNVLDLSAGTTDNVTAYDDLDIYALVDKNVFNCNDVGHQVAVQVFAVDESGNKGSCSTLINVIDTLPLKAGPVDDIDVNISAGKCDTTITYPEPITSNKCATFTPLSGLGSGGDFPVGTTTEEWLLSNTQGDSLIVSFNVNVTADNLPPTFAPVANIDTTGHVAELIVPLSGISDGGDCVAQDLMITALGSNPGIVSSIDVNYTSPAPTGELVLNIAPGANGSGTITVTVTDSEGGSVSQTFTVTVDYTNQAPEVNNAVPDQEINTGDTLVIPIIGTGGIFSNPDLDSLYVEVTNGNGGDLPGWIIYGNDTLSIMPSATDSGCVTVVVDISDPAGASASDTFEVCVNKSLVGVQDIELNSLDLTLFPNPTNGEVNLKFDAPVTGEIELLVTDITGRRVLQKTYRSQQLIRLNLSDQVSGMYLININLNGIHYMKKLILDKK